MSQHLITKDLQRKSILSLRAVTALVVALLLYLTTRGIGVIPIGCTSDRAPGQFTRTPGTYSTNFPLSENPISEGGNWINGKTAGLDWSNVQTTPNFAFGTQVINGHDTDSTATLTGTWGPNQTVQATVRLLNFSGGETELRLRTNISAHSITGYEILAGSGGGYCQIVRWNGPLDNFTVLYNPTAAPCSRSLRNGSIIKATIVTSGNVAIITAYVDGIQIMQATDSNPWTTGAPGLGFFLNTGAVNNGFGFSSFTATGQSHATIH